MDAIISKYEKFMNESVELDSDSDDNDDEKKKQNTQTFLLVVNSIDRNYKSDNTFSYTCFSDSNTTSSGATLIMALISAPAAMAAKKVNERATPTSNAPANQSRICGTTVARLTVIKVIMA